VNCTWSGAPIPVLTGPDIH